MLKLYPQRTVLAVNFLTSFSAWNEADIYQKPSAITSNLRSNSQWSVSKPNTSNETVSWGKETLVSVLVSNGYRSSFVRKLAKTTRVTVKFPHSPILHYAFSSWIEKTMTKTIAIGNTDFFTIVWGSTKILPIPFTVRLTVSACSEWSVLIADWTFSGYDVEWSYCEIQPFL